MTISLRGGLEARVTVLVLLVGALTSALSPSSESGYRLVFASLAIGGVVRAASLRLRIWENGQVQVVGWISTREISTNKNCRPTIYITGYRGWMTVGMESGLIRMVAIEADGAVVLCPWLSFIESRAVASIVNRAELAGVPVEFRSLRELEL